MVTNSEHITLPEECSNNTLGETEILDSGSVPNGLDEDDDGICGTSSSELTVAPPSAAAALSMPQEDKVTNKRKANTKNEAIDEAAEKSVNYRRSTRVSAIKAAERIKHKDALTPIMEYPAHSSDGYASSDDEAAAQDSKPPPQKIRRIAADRILDQCSSRFSIKLDEDEVVLMTSESEFSNIDEDEFEQLRKSYDKAVSKELGEKNRMDKVLNIKREEAKLRKEESKLVALRKILSSQKSTVKQTQDANTKKITANIIQNGSGTAYKPPLATPQVRSSSTNMAHAKSTPSLSNNSSRVAAHVNSLLNLTPQQQQMLQTVAKSGLLTPTAAQAFIQQMQQSSQLNGRLQQQQHVAALAAAAALAHQSKLTGCSATVKETPAQKAAAAKLNLRRQLEQQLLQIPPPHPPPPDMNFIPNGTQPDFCALLGLDIVVQRLLKDRNAVRRVTEEPYTCEECGTNYTPQWRAIGPTSDSLHLYCDACVKSAQKKKIRMDHTLLLRKAFDKVLEKEQELERQIAEGKFDSSAPSSSVAVSSHHAAVTASSSATPPPASQKGVSQLHTVSSTSKLSHTSQQQQATKHHSHQHSHHSSNHVTGHKRSGTSISSSTNVTSMASSVQNVAAAAALAAAANANNSHAVLLQQQIAAAAALRHSNPMLAAMMANPLLNAPNMLPMQWNPLLQNRLPNFAMAALAQAVQNAQQSGNTSASNSATSTPAMNAVSINPFTALASSMNPAATMLSNPHVIRQLQNALSRNMYDLTKTHAKK